MATKRMISTKVVDSDAFLDMPLSSQCLYFHLNVRADDDGFVDNPKRILRMIGASDDDLKILFMKRFLIIFESGVIVIKHWRIHNTLSKNRYTETTYLEEKQQLLLKDNGSYSLEEGSEIDDSHLISMSSRQVENSRRTKDEQKTNTDKNRIDKNSKDKNNAFVPPSVEEVRKYCEETGKTHVNPEVFVNFYESKGWMIGKNKMKSWKKTTATWEANKQNNSRYSTQATTSYQKNADLLDGIL